jgi:4-hydroxy-tetrahydrodipicolinate synthase
MKNELKSTSLWTAIITPFLKDGKIDFKSLEGLLRQQEKFHNGVVLLGSTGEGLALSRNEKESILKFAQSLNLSIPTISGVPGHNLDEALDFIRFAKTTGVKGFLSVTPYYAKPGVSGQIRWFKSILDEAGLPVMLYNVPSRTGMRLAPEVLSELKDHANLWALKESSGSVDSFQEYQRVNSSLSFFCGDDGLMPAFAKAGAIGLVSVAANVWPEATRKVVELSLAKKADECLPMWQAATDALFLASNPIPTKFLHLHLGQIETTHLKAPLDLADLKETQKVIYAHETITKWLAERKAL